ncbi:MAG: anti-sigma factor antagonist [Ruminiclostridium sp.]|nr:anti-sigma factor antagonist [Ruminiclostridium sp.]
MLCDSIRKGGIVTGVELIRKNGCITAHISGEIDHHEAAGIRMEIDPELERLMPTMLILDMSEVSFMESSGIGLILGRQRIMESLGGGITVKNPSPSVRRILMIAGLSRLIIGTDKTEGKNEVR